MKKRGLLLVSILMLFSFLTVACGSSEDNEESGEKEKKKIELTIDQTTVTTDENGKALIEGTVDPKAKLSIDGTTVKQDSDGRFTFTKIINSDSEARVYAKLIAVRTNYEDEEYSVIINNNSKAYNDNMAKQEAIQNEEAKKTEKERKAAEEKAKQEEAATTNENTPSDDTVYGTLASKDTLTKEGDAFYKDEELDVLYSTVENDEIFQVLIQLGDESTIRKDLDKNHLTELARDYMESDATLIQTVSDESFVYESPSINKTYTVDYMLNDEGYVIAVYVTQAM
ncbi:DUF4969 domain-containing protein [Listeria marthii]|uniref:DUF4969 domain-containing protein n=1 Tax=Listeria marthii TaxID=529731 RepID=UPI001887419B|nr:DUF4969 domain-containing protein [Listeria marthii]MBF2516966.1 DUF4969 domain-containing protein [Listeria marthii]MBF2519765.1 DUF4969 domain-containing protein [Listeria marthii]